MENRSGRCKNCKKMLRSGSRTFPEGTIDDGHFFYCNQECYDKNG